jgi:hypothetical protein
LKVLEDSLKSEKEEQIARLNTELSKVNAECNTLKQELAQSQRRHAHENSVIATDNAILQRKYEDLDGHYMALGWRKDQKEVLYQTHLQIMTQEIGYLRRALMISHSANHHLKEGLKDLQNYVLSSTKKNIRMLRKVKVSIFDLTQLHIAKSAEKQSRKGNRQIAAINSELQTEKLKHQQLQSATQFLLDSIWNISPYRKDTSKVTIDEFPLKISEVHSFLEASIEDQRKAVTEDFKKELAISHPELSQDGSRATTLKEIVDAVIEEKDAEIEAKVRRFEEKEKKLRRVLENTVSVVRPSPIQSGSPIKRKNVKDKEKEKAKSMSPVSFSRTEMDLREMDLLRGDWETQRRGLDSRMKELERMIPLERGRVVRMVENESVQES